MFISNFSLCVAFIYLSTLRSFGSAFLRKTSSSTYTRLTSSQRERKVGGNTITSLQLGLEEFLIVCEQYSFPVICGFAVLSSPGMLLSISRHVDDDSKATANNQESVATVLASTIIANHQWTDEDLKFICPQTFNTKS